LVIIPAFNEEGAIARVVREVHQFVPGVAVLVIDDCSSDGTIAAARSAGAGVLPMPHHLGLGGCVQAGYKLAWELGYSYVIRVDGDGQHDPRDIPRVFEKLRSSGCEMVIGSRFVTENGSRTGTVRSLGIRFFRLVLRPILGKPVITALKSLYYVVHVLLGVFVNVLKFERRLHLSQRRPEEEK
jgi:glycosyltransferase involved in cell wall biosynthesis